MQGKFKEVQGELAGLTVSGESGGGIVTVRVNGKQEVLDIEIAREAIDNPDKDMLETLLVAACNDALQKAREQAETLMKEKTGGLLGGALDGLKIPGL